MQAHIRSKDMHVQMHTEIHTGIHSVGSYAMQINTISRKLLQCNVHFMCNQVFHLKSFQH